MHLDDPSPEMQSTVFGALCEIIRLNDDSSLKIILQRVEEVRSSHRDPALCNLLEGKVKDVSRVCYAHNLR